MLASIVLTATVCPPDGAPMLTRADKATRVADYLAAASFYLSRPWVRRIYFLENSGHSIETELLAIPSRFGATLDYRQYLVNDHPAVYGKGYGEFRMLDAFVQDQTIDLDDEEPVWKITGRLMLTNLPAIEPAASNQTPLYVDLKKFPKKWMQLRCFRFTKRAYRQLLENRYKELREDKTGCAPEEILYRWALESWTKKTSNMICRFSTEPRYIGHSGCTGASLSAGGELWKYRCRHFLRTFLPSLWV